MNAEKSILMLVALFISLGLSGCGAGQIFGPTITPTSTPTAIPTMTPTATATTPPTATLTPIPTKTPIPTPKPASIYGRVTVFETDKPLVTDVLLLDALGQQTDFTTDTDGKFSIQLIPDEQYSLMVVVLANNPALASCTFISLPDNDIWSFSVSMENGEWVPRGAILSDFTVSAGEELEQDLSIPCNCDSQKGFCVKIH